MNIEELNLDGEELEIIGKAFGASRYEYPVVTFCENLAYFNKPALDIVPEFVELAVTPEYVIGRKSEKGNKNAYKTRVVHGVCKLMTFPAKLKREKKFKPGTYKLYKCRDGFALKRYEPMEG